MVERERAGRDGTGFTVCARDVRDPRRNDPRRGPARRRGDGIGPQSAAGRGSAIAAATNPPAPIAQHRPSRSAARPAWLGVKSRRSCQLVSLKISPKAGPAARAAAELLTVDGDDALAAEGRAALERIKAELPDAELRRRFEHAEPVRVLAKRTSPETPTDE